MATPALGAQPGGNPWSSMGPSPPPQSHLYQQGIATPYYGYNLQPKNHVDLTRERLIAVLNHFSHLLASAFSNRPLRLVVHGGACMLLHPGVYALSLEQQHYLPQLPHRNKTRDVDIIHRSFVTEMAQLGITNAAEKLKGCILATAQQFGLGADWMNSDADIALPMATAPSGITFDPIYTAAVQPNNMELHTIYRSPNGMLTLISVTPFWAVALKLVRYSPQDAADICLLLRNGTKLSNTNWTTDILRDWLFTNCWPMGYQHYDRMRLRNINQRIEHALQTLTEWSTNEGAQPTHPTQSAMAAAFMSVNIAPTPMHHGITPLAAMGGGGEILGGENATEGGWKPSWPSASGPWHPESMSEKRRRSQSRSAHPSPTTPPADVVSDAFHDPYDFGVVPHDQDAAAAARKAKKKAKAEKKKGKSTSAPASASSSVPYLSPPPPYPGTGAPVYGSPYDQTSGYLSDKKTTGLASLSDMAHALTLEQTVGHMLVSGPSTAPPRPGEWGRPEQMKKSRSKDKDQDKRKREKEKERKKSRKEKRTSPQWDPFPPPPIVPFEDVLDSGEDDSDTDDSEDDTTNVRQSLAHIKSWAAPAYTPPQHSPPKPNPPPPPQAWPPPPNQPGSGPPPQTHAYSHPTQNAQSPFIPPTYTNRPMQHFYGSNGPQLPQTPFVSPQPPQPQPPGQSNHKRPPLSVSRTWHASTYPGMNGAGPAPPMAMTPSATHQASASVPRHPQMHYSNPLRDIQNIASNTSSRPSHHQNSSSMSMLGLTSGPPGNQRKEKDVQPFVPPAEIFMNNFPPPRMPY